MSQAFLKCVANDNGPQAIWLRQLKTKLNNTVFHRQMEAGEKMDNSANAIYLHHVKKICAALAKANDRESATRKLGVKSTWRCAGRSSDAGGVGAQSIRATA